MKNFLSITLLCFCALGFLDLSQYLSARPAKPEITKGWHCGQKLCLCKNRKTHSHSHDAEKPSEESGGLSRPKMQSLIAEMLKFKIKPLLITQAGRRTSDSARVTQSENKDKDLSQKVFLSTLFTQRIMLFQKDRFDSLLSDKRIDQPPKFFFSF